MFIFGARAGRALSRSATTNAWMDAVFKALREQCGEAAVLRRGAALLSACSQVRTCRQLERCAASARAAPHTAARALQVALLLQVDIDTPAR